MGKGHELRLAQLRNKDIHGEAVVASQVRGRQWRALTCVARACDL